MSRLLAAEGPAALLEGLEHVPVADRRLHHVDAARRHGLAEAQVGHDRHGHGVVLQTPPLAQVESAQGDDLVTVDELTAVVDGEHSVGIAVESEPSVRALLDDRLLQLLGVGRPTAFVDVGAVGVG